MKFTKLISLISIITVLSLIYVYQQNEIIRLAYAGQKKEALLLNLLDQNSLLRYDIEKNSSLVKIGYSFDKSSEFQMPDYYQVVKLVGHGPRIALVNLESESKPSFLERILGINTRAEAKTNP